MTVNEVITLFNMFMSTVFTICGNFILTQPYISSLPFLHTASTESLVDYKSL